MNNDLLIILLHNTEYEYLNYSSNISTLVSYYQ